MRPVTKGPATEGPVTEGPVTKERAIDAANEAVGPVPGGGSAPRYSRRLSDKILIAFHQACDQADFGIAESLLHVLEAMLRRRPLVADTNRRRSMESLVAAHERLWYLRHPGDAG